MITFGTDAIYKLQTATNIDPEQSALNTRHTYVELFSIGTKNEFISRTIIQFHKILSSVIFENKKIDIYKLESKIWEIAQKLITCDCRVADLINAQENIIEECDKIIEINKKSSIIPGLPQVVDLNEKVNTFFLESKKILIIIFKIINIFYDRNIATKKEAHFDKAVNWLKDHLGINNDLWNMLEHDLKWIQILAECRNAIEHPKAGYSVSVYNFIMCQGNKFAPPSWQYDLSDKKLGKIDPVQLIPDLLTMLNNMLSLFESVLLLCIRDNFAKNIPFTIIKYSTFNKNCPLLYGLSLHSVHK